MFAKAGSTTDIVFDSVAARRILKHRLWRKIHLYLGLFVGFLFAFSGLTGSALVFYKAIDEFLNPELLIVEPGTDVARAPLAEIINAAQEAVPGEMKPTQLILPRHSQATAIVRFAIPEADGGGQVRVSVNPFTAEVLGEREWGGYFMSVIYKLHYTLLLGDVGETIVGIMGLLLISSILSGLVLWWPKLTKLSRAFTFRRSANRIRFIYDLHKTIGAYVAVVLVVIAFSGIYMIFPQYVKPLVGMVSPLTEIMPVQLSTAADTGARRLDVDEISGIANDLFPYAELQRIRFPTSVDGVYRVIMYQPGDVRRTSGSTQLWIDPYDGNVLAIQTPQTMSGGDTFINWMFPLHNGEAFGLPGRIIVFLVGFVPTILYVTGLMIWWRKRKARIWESRRLES